MLNDHFRNWLIYQISARKLDELVICADNSVVRELMYEMVEDSGVPWIDILLAYKMVEQDCKAWGAN